MNESKVLTLTKENGADSDDNEKRQKLCIGENILNTRRPFDRVAVNKS